MVAKAAEKSGRRKKNNSIQHDENWETFPINLIPLQTLLSLFLVSSFIRFIALYNCLIRIENEKNGEYCVAVWWELN